MFDFLQTSTTVLNKVQAQSVLGKKAV